MGFAQLGEAMDAYDAVSEKLNARVAHLRKQSVEIESEIEEQAGNAHAEGGITATVGVFAPEAGQIDLVLSYGMSVCLLCFVVIN